MVSKHKLLAVIATGSVLATSFLGIQTFYTNDVASNQVSLRTPTAQGANFSGGGYESTSSSASSNITATQLATSSATGSLQSSLESEAAERKTQDEKISKSVGAINNTLLGYIGSSSTSNIGNGTLRGAIGNTSIAGIGTENNLSSAIVGLDGRVSTISENQSNDELSIKTLQDKTASKRIVLNKNFQKTEQSYTNAALKGKDYIDVYVWCTTTAFSKVLRVYDDTISCYSASTGTAYSISCPIMFNSDTGTVNWICHDYTGWTACSAWQVNSIYYY